MIRKYLIALAVMPSIAFAQEGSKVALASDPFNEVLREAAQISGARLVGVTSVGANGPVPQVAATIPADWKDAAICLKIVSADGLYEAFNAYTVASDWPGGTITLPYPSNTPDQVARIPGGLIAGIVLRGDCASAATEAAPVFWGGAPFGAIRVLLNTARADETFVTFPDHPEVGDVVCAPVAIAARNAFDTACTIPDSLTRLDRVAAVALSFKGGEMGREEPITLRLGAVP